MRRWVLGVLIVGVFIFLGTFLILRPPPFLFPTSIEGMVMIPPGPFIMGSDEVDQEGRAAEFGLLKPIYLDEHPRRSLHLPRYYIDQYEVTNEAYRSFVRDQERNPPPHWKEGRFPDGQERHPVINVNWYEAEAYCRWKGKRLPTEAEWEKAGRGSEGRVYPWGNAFDARLGNVGQTGVGRPVAVGSYSLDRSVYGVYDLAGNVMEWTADWYQAYPGSDHASDLFGEAFKVTRGDAFGSGGHYHLSLFTRLSYRQNVFPEARFDFLGFRCAKDG